MNTAARRRTTPTLVAVCLGTFMLLVDVTIVTVAIPSIRDGLDATLADAQWTIDGYALALAALLLPAGSLADILGARRVFGSGLVVFVLGSLLCGLAASGTELVAFRVLQGIGGAAVFSTSLALLAQTFQGASRGMAFGVWGAVVSFAMAVAPVLGGLLTTALSWRWIFFLNVPVGIAAILIAVVGMRAAATRKGGRIDVAGLVVVAGGLVGVIGALIEAGRYGWGSPIVLVPLALGVALLIAFPFVERAQRAPMFDLRLLRIPTFVGGLVAGFGLNATLYAMLVYLVLYLQGALGTSALGVGLELLVVTGASVVAAILSGRLLARASSRWPLGAGLVLIGTGLLLMRGVGVGVAWTQLIPGFVVAGLGSGLVGPALGATAVGTVPPERAGMASGMNSAVRQVGVAASVAVLGSIWSQRIGAGGTGGAVRQAAALDELLAISGAAALVAGIAAFVLVRPKDFHATARG